MGIYTGYCQAGIMGGLVAGMSFIAPAFGIVVLLSWLYFRFQTLPQLQSLFLGVAPVIMALIAGFCWKLAKKSIRHWVGAAVVGMVFMASFFGHINVLLLLVLAGLVGIFRHRWHSPPFLPGFCRCCPYPSLLASPINLCWWPASGAWNGCKTMGSRCCCFFCRWAVLFLGVAW